MRCPNCQKEVSSSARNCYYCGAALSSANTQSYQPPQATDVTPAPKAVVKAHREFVKSPLILFAIIAYTFYAGILLIKFIPMLAYIDDCFDVIGESLYLFVAMISTIFLFVPSLIISVGLWIMYSSEGKEGADLVNRGIKAYIGLNIAILLSVFLLVVIYSDGFSLLETFDELILPFAYGIFELIVAWMVRAFVDSVEYTALGDKTNTDGVAKAGTMMLIYLGFMLLGVLGLVNAMDLGASLSTSFSKLGDSLSTLANIAYLVALGLFGVAAHVYCKAMKRAERIDNEK